jgi:hypothetical protein
MLTYADGIKAEMHCSIVYAKLRALRSALKLLVYVALSY